MCIECGVDRRVHLQKTRRLFVLAIKQAIAMLKIKRHKSLADKHLLVPNLKCSIIE